MIGNMVGHCSVLTSEENIKRATEDMQLAETYEDITEIQEQSTSLKHEKLKYAMMDDLSSAITKFQTNNYDFAKITKIELAEIMLSLFKIVEDPSKINKPELVQKATEKLRLLVYLLTVYLT